MQIIINDKQEERYNPQENNANLKLQEERK